MGIGPMELIVILGILAIWAIVAIVLIRRR